MKKFALFLTVLTFICFIFAISAYASPFGGEVTDTFYVVASQDSEAALSLKAEGKEVIVLSEVYANVSAPTDSDWINSFAEGSHIELIFAENIIEEVSAYTGILLGKATSDKKKKISPREQLRREKLALKQAKKQNKNQKRKPLK